MLVVNAIATENAIVARVTRKEDRIEPFNTTARKYASGASAASWVVAGSGPQVQ
jgi:hypothetical protein